ncbi:RagB/SusD family nutrient uptake outer membrane protein [Maribellus maritimus]|uniref:RagB/SusD family nutrient uptake outer membrane protein n=1 Tax=Maribellus maritimus TaxID=2870838 RepID=UPI001EEA0A1E|nr:RagB/SusD family nutrient uptake outer membrane protein [Maribellus maritimus]MCG6191127.1 RagB/SusD family nutrient uptake outer membrane protein [Maribellus maritimus]
MKTVNILARITMVFVLLVSINACTTDDLDPSLEQNKLIQGGITSVDNLYAILKGSLSRMTEVNYYGRDYVINNEVRTDNCFSNGNSGRFITQATFSYNANTGYFWDEAYEAIAGLNIIINGVDLNELEGDMDYGTHLQGQAYALRALIHFDLLKQYGQQHVGGTLGVPYVTEFKGEDLLPARKSVEETKQLILGDLETAFNMMSEDYSSKVLPSKYLAKAIESNVAVYFGMWDRAITASEAVINSGLYDIISANSFASSWENGLAANSIFELAFNETDNRGSDAIAYIYRGGSYGDVQVIDEIADLYEAGDVRADILGYEDDMLRNMGKFPEIQGYDNVPVVRYEEIILNYAEALLETGGDALTEINKITSNRGASAYETVTKDDILNERRKEFIFEGKRYDDLLRTGSDIEKVYMQQNIAATISYGDHRLAWPVPKAETDANSNMIQNEGY